MIELGLQRITRLLARTPLPWRGIHVAGTNGKGSICAYISSMLETYNTSPFRQSTGFAPLKHARFTSPHLIDRWDCITINQRTVDAELFKAVENAVARRNKHEGIAASEFELLTATAFEIFTREQVDVAVVEVGMGGRLDATNVIGMPDEAHAHEAANGDPFRPLPLVTAIAKIGLDHQAFLGDSLEAIAREKAGIMKPGVPVVFDLSNPESVIGEFWKSALEVGTNPFELTDPEMPCRFLGEEVRHAFVPSELNHPTFPATGSTTPQHTQRNMSVAFRSAWMALVLLGRIPPVLRCHTEDLAPHEQQAIGQLASAMLHNALNHTGFPGRLQDISLAPLTDNTRPVLLDGAHNVQSAEVLAAKVDRRRERVHNASASVTWVLALSSTKLPDPILRTLVRPGDRVYAVEFGPVDGMPWVKPTGSDEIVSAAKEIFGDGNGRSVEAQGCGRDVLGALRKASNATQNGQMVVGGSLYLVGEVLRMLRDGPPP